MWNDFTTDSAVGIRAEITTYPGGMGDEIHAYVARPLAASSRGGVILLHHMPGWDEFFQETAERLARHGYDVIVPDLYCRFGHGTADDMSAKVRSEGGVPDASVIADSAAARDWLRALPTSNGKVGIMGTCSGGRHSVLVASTVHGFDAVVDCWGGGVIMSPDQITPARPVEPITLTADLDAPVLGLFGNDDPSPSPEDVDRHEEELKKFGKTYEFHRYDGAPHAYFCYDRLRYRHEAAMESWEHIFRFFNDNLSA
jgi:carboxymethylenebutenolidase